MESAENKEILDIVVLGAGLSGICAGYYLKTKCPNKSFTILEAREKMGGTWDLFKYPGIRSDSDMYTLGYSFSPWKDPKAIADGSSILEYIKETAANFKIDQHIRFSHKAIKAEWTDEEQLWKIEIQDHPNVTNKILYARFVFACSGYYNYDEGHVVQFPNQESFKGNILHPQKWDTSLDYSGKNVVVIGSGATAVTLVPEMAKTAASVTMLQRSPTYIVNLPSEDIIANVLKKILPLKLAHKIARWKNIFLSVLIYNLCRKWPDAMRKFFKKRIQKVLGDKYLDKDFDPYYKPWDQRLCLIPDNDLFESLKDGNANIITDHIEQFNEKGILLKSGKQLDADLIVTATGLKIQILGGIDSKINGKPINTGEMKAYKGVLFDGVPNFAVAIGYTNASWTLKAELSCRYVAKLINYMDKENLKVVTPRFDNENLTVEPLLDFDAGYINRALDILPKQGSKAPWKVYQNYLKDVWTIKYASFTDKYLDYK